MLKDLENNKVIYGFDYLKNINNISWGERKQGYMFKDYPDREIAIISDKIYKIEEILLDTKTLQYNENLYKEYLEKINTKHNHFYIEDIYERTYFTYSSLTLKEYINDISNKKWINVFHDIKDNVDEDVDEEENIDFYNYYNTNNYFGIYYLRISEISNIQKSIDDNEYRILNSLHHIKYKYK